MGITSARLLTDGDAGTETRMMRQGSQSLFVYAEREGWFEPAVDIGDVVAEGDTAGWLHDLEAPLAEPEVLRFRAGGIVLSRRLHTHSQSGDCLMNLAQFVD